MEIDFFDTLEKVKAMDYDSVEFACGFFGYTGKEDFKKNIITITEECKKNGIAADCVGGVVVFLYKLCIKLHNLCIFT